MERFISEPLWDEDLVIAVPDTHPWVGRTNVKPAELSRQPLILMEAGNCLRDQTLALCNIPINEVAATTIDMATALRLVKVGRRVSGCARGGFAQQAKGRPLAWPASPSLFPPVAWP